MEVIADNKSFPLALLYLLLSFVVICGGAWFVLIRFYLLKWDFVKEMLGRKVRPNWIPSVIYKEIENQRMKENLEKSKQGSSAETDKDK
jgi:hypothetical protein